jgi:hypothetical protein
MTDIKSFTRIGEDKVDVTEVRPPDPSLRRFREAWKLNPEKTVIQIDMVKAKEIAHQQLRNEAKVVLEHLRDQIEERQDANQNATALINRRKGIRAALVDPRIDAATTPEALRDVVQTIIAELKA